jgi:hypothetical protein
MTKKYDLDEIKERIKLARETIPNYFTYPINDFETAAQETQSALNYSIQATNDCGIGSEQSDLGVILYPMLCEAYFAFGFAGGLTGAKKRLDGNRALVFRSVEKIVVDLKKSIKKFRREPYYGLHHKVIGYNLGQLGLIGEGHILLEGGNYLDRMEECKRIL